MKKILIISGTHGNEYAAVDVGMTLLEYYRSDKRITVIPWLNESGLYDNSRDVTGSKSTTDLNRSFHEEFEFGESHKHVCTKLKHTIEDYDIVIDIHNSWRCSNFFLVDMGINQKEIISYCRSAGTKYASRYSKGGTIKDYVNSCPDKIGFTYEFAGMDNLNTEAEKETAILDITNLVIELQNDNNIQSHDIHELKSVYTLSSGFIKIHVDINHFALEGDLLFDVLGSEGQIIDTVIAPEDLQVIAYGTQFQKRGSAVLQYSNIK